MASSMSDHRQFRHSHLLFFLIAECLLKQADALEQQAESTEQEAMKRAEEEAAKQAQIQQLEISVKELQERINAANKGKQLQGLPELWKRVRDEDMDSLAINEESPINSEEQNQPLAKIPKKMTDMSTCFNAVDEPITFVPGWQPIARGSGLLITMLKSFKEKVWCNEFFSYRELHRTMNRPKTTNSLKLIFDKLIKQEELSVPSDKDSMRLLGLNIYQLQFFTLYSQMYPQHAVSHMEHQLTLYSLIQP